MNIKQLKRIAQDLSDDGPMSAGSFIAATPVYRSTEVRHLICRILELEECPKPPTIARPMSEWREEMGCVLLWRFPRRNTDRASVGNPAHDTWACADWYTHFTTIDKPELPPSWETAKAPVVNCINDVFDLREG